MAELIAVERHGNVALIRMLRADKHNAFNRALSTELTAAIEALEADGDVHAAILIGTGNAFSAGADMTEAVRAIDGTGRSEGMGATIARIARFPKPMLAAVNGICYGGGALLAITCDIRISAENAAFRFPGAAYGLVVGGTQLPRVVGAPKAKELLFTGRVVKAQEALQIGLVNHVVPHDHVEGFTMEMAQQIAGNSPEALIATKATVERATQVDDAVQVENAANIRLRESPEHHRRFREATARVARGGSGKEQHG